jgi:hypothetical protein
MKKQKSKTIHVKAMPDMVKGNVKHEIEMPTTGYRDSKTGEIVRTTSAAAALQTAFKTAKDPKQQSGQSAFLDVRTESLKADHGTDPTMLYKGKKKK